MICPVCNGVGRVEQRFLLFFTRRARCPKCLGTGEFPPPVSGLAGYRAPYRDDDDGTWPVTRYGSTSTGFRTGSSPGSSPDAVARDADRFEVGSGGSSGGAGGGASWDTAEGVAGGAGNAGSAPPVIADPFSTGASISSGASSIASSGASSIVASAVAAEAISADSSSSTSDGSSSSSSSDSATSY